MTTDKKAKKTELKATFWKKVDELLMSECTGVEVAAYFGISKDALYARCEREKKIGFALYKQQLKAKGDSLLRHAQFERAIKMKDGRMQIFLGKNRLGQTDRQIIITEEAPQKKILGLPDNGRRIVTQVEQIETTE